MIAGKQNQDGSWGASGEGYAADQQPELSNADLDLNAEYTLWLALISSNILARDAV
jgi:hypothetical protein